MKPLVTDARPARSPGLPGPGVGRWVAVVGLRVCLPAPVHGEEPLHVHPTRAGPLSRAPDSGTDPTLEPGFLLPQPQDPR